MQRLLELRSQYLRISTNDDRAHAEGRENVGIRQLKRILLLAKGCSRMRFQSLRLYLPLILCCVSSKVSSKWNQAEQRNPHVQCARALTRYRILVEQLRHIVLAIIRETAISPICLIKSIIRCDYWTAAWIMGRQRDECWFVRIYRCLSDPQQAGWYHYGITSTSKRDLFALPWLFDSNRQDYIMMLWNSRILSIWNLS